MTHRVWSLVEKEVDRQVKNLIGITHMKMHLSDKRSLISDESLENEDVFQQFAFFCCGAENRCCQSIFIFLFPEFNEYVLILF